MEAILRLLENFLSNIMYQVASIINNLVYGAINNAEQEMQNAINQKLQSRKEHEQQAEDRD
ncbi:hypothetical protein H6G76_21750 [Nostoc sp. FACHB-152]|uniref:hypothetical protein n=1 Tax=unclassified Nostoc TaxID=2593658 RepID=UPI0016881932|nr:MULTISPECIES: hypothetical protein [unclassified Nostoc]MBD2449741.1 hypothetical protein [Nostoc sp. FACHB-152]MBD2469882.1 hypothetical protein [Nostoc sp. FACHB-145]